MRRTGTFGATPEPLAPHDHAGFAFADGHDLTSLARNVLAAGAALGERLLFVAADPDPSAVAGLTDSLGAAPTVASVADVYGADGFVDPVEQRRTFEALVDSALEAGYSGLRMVADNTPLVTTADRLRRFADWESVADDLSSAAPFTAVCCFDRRQVGSGGLRYLAGLHPVAWPTLPEPPYRIFVDDSDVVIEGIVDTFAVDDLRRTVSALGGDRRVVVAPDTTSIFSTRARAELSALTGESHEPQEERP